MFRFSEPTLRRIVKCRAAAPCSSRLPTRLAVLASRLANLTGDEGVNDAGVTADG